MGHGIRNVIVFIHIIVNIFDAAVVGVSSPNALCYMEYGIRDM